MVGKFLALMSGTALLGMVGVASAGEPVILAQDQLDQITAGVAYVSAELSGDAVATGSFFLDVFPGNYSTAQIQGTIYPFSGNPTLTLNAYAQTE